MRLIAQARLPRIKNAHSADQEILKVAPQFGWMIFNHCKSFALLCYDRLGRPLQTFMSVGIPTTDQYDSTVYDDIGWRPNSFFMTSLVE